MPSEALSFQRFLVIDAHSLTSVAVSGSELLNVAFFLWCFSRYNFQVLTEGIILVDTLFGVPRVDQEGSVGALLIVHTKNLFTRSSEDTFMIRHQTLVPAISHVMTK